MTVRLDFDFISLAEKEQWDLMGIAVSQKCSTLRPKHAAALAVENFEVQPAAKLKDMHCSSPDMWLTMP